MSYPKAASGARIVAWLLDLLIASAGVLLVPLVVLAGAPTPGPELWPPPAGDPSLGVVALGLLAILVATLWGFGYSLAKDGLAGGRSLGKRAMGLMVVHRPTDAPCTYAQSALRALLLLGTNAIPFVGTFVEPIAALADPEGRRLGDRVADTQVVSVAEWEARRARRAEAAALRDPTLDPMLDPMLDPHMREALREVDAITRRGPA